MSSSTRFAIWSLIIVTAVCAGLAALSHSELLAILAAGCATFAVIVGFASTDVSPETASAYHVGYSPTTSATVDVVDMPRPATMDATDAGGEASNPVPFSSPYRSTEPAGAPSGVGVPAFPHTKMPVGSEPREVVGSLLAASHAAGYPVAAHLWLEDPATETLRLVEAQGHGRPDPVPVSSSEGLLGSALAEGIAHLGMVEPAMPAESGEHRWRYTIPLVSSDLRGVAAIDFSGHTEPDRAVLTSISASLRASLSGALALHVAHAEAQTARILVESCARLARMLDPDEVLSAALEQAMQLASAQTGSIMLVDPDSRRMRIAVSRGLADEVVSSTDVPEGDGIAGWVLASKQPLVIEDLKQAGIRSRRHGIRSAVCVPLRDDEGILGVLNLGCASFHARISRSHLEALEVLGRTVVVALRSSWAAEGAHDLYFDTLKAFAFAMEARDPYSRGNTARVVQLVEAMARSFALSDDDAQALRIAAMLHDVGMSAAGTVAPITDAPLSTVEWGMLKMHPIIAAEIMSQAPALESVVPLVYHHHEHYDGSGYVTGLSGSEIPLGSRILAVADAFVAMTSSRPYRTTLSNTQAMNEIERLAGTQFDPQVVAALATVLGERRDEMRHSH